MRHRKLSQRLSRHIGHRKAILRNLARGLIEKERIITTPAKAKEARRLVEELITLGKQKDLNSQRKANAVLIDRRLTSYLFKEVAPRFEKRIGGYTRIIGLGSRKGDGAELVILELTEKKPVVKEKPKKKEKKEKEKEIPKTEEKHEEKTPPPQAKTEKPKERTITKQKPKGLLGSLRKFFGGPKGRSSL